MILNKKQKLGFTLLNTLLFSVIYFVAAERGLFPWNTLFFLAAGAGIGIWFVVYNRGFAFKDATPEMLPNTMTAAEKEEKLRDARCRFEQSKWVLVILVPIILVFLFDMVYLFIFPTVEGWFS